MESGTSRPSPEGVAITATRRRTKSAINDGRRSNWPSIQWVLHCQVLALDITDFAEAFAKRSGMARNGRPGLDEADDRHRRLLRARGERPCRRTGKRSNEFSSPDADCHVTLRGGHATDGTDISDPAVLRCGISNRLMTATGHSRPSHFVPVPNNVRFAPKATIIHPGTDCSRCSTRWDVG